MDIVIDKAARKLCVLDGERMVFGCRIALGRTPEGAKEREGDGRTPEGRYFICLVKEHGKYGRSLGVSYPGVHDAQKAFAEGRIDERTCENIVSANRERRRPPWGSPLGGEIYIHEGGSESDWTEGCIALDASDMNRLFALYPLITEVEIRK